MVLDANDAAAICEAVSRPSMRFVAIKTKEQQAALMLHRPDVMPLAVDEQAHLTSPLASRPFPTLRRPEIGKFSYFNFRRIAARM
jgi:hypothetical protein